MSESYATVAGGHVELEERKELASGLLLPEPWSSANVMVVLPTYQEAVNLPVIVAALFNLPLTRLRVLVVDDHSPDGTGQVAEQLADNYGRHRLSVVRRSLKQGLGRA